MHARQGMSLPQVESRSRNGRIAMLQPTTIRAGAKLSNSTIGRPLPGTRSLSGDLVVRLAEEGGDLLACLYETAGDVDLGVARPIKIQAPPPTDGTRSYIVRRLFEQHHERVTRAR